MPITLHRFSLEDYQRMIDTGILGKSHRVELIQGEIIDMAPMGQEHIFGILSYNQQLVQTYANEALVLVQCPIQIFPDSEPEPDFVLLKPPIDAYASRKPKAEDVFLIIELSHSTLEYDRTQKLDLYAKATIPEVWLHNFQENILEVFRQPNKGKYRTHLRFLPGETVTPLFSSTSFLWKPNLG